MGALDTDMRVRCGTSRRMPAACALLMSALVLAGTTASTAGAQEILLSRAPDREQMILDGARKEGQVVLYSAAIVNQALRPLAEAFMKTYPFVKMTFWRGDTEEIVAKLSAEARAGNVVADVAEGTGVGDLAVGAGLTQPYYTPMVEALPEHYRDPRSHWTSTRISYFSIAYNTRLVPPDQAPKSYDDLTRSALAGQARLAHRDRQRHAAVHHDHPAGTRRGAGRRVSSASSPRRRSSISDRAARARSSIASSPASSRSRSTSSRTTR